MYKFDALTDYRAPFNLGLYQSHIKFLIENMAIDARCEEYLGHYRANHQSNPDIRVFAELADAFTAED